MYIIKIPLHPIGKLLILVMTLKLLKFPKMFWKSSDLGSCMYYNTNIQGQGLWQFSV